MRISFLIAGVCLAIAVILAVNYWTEFSQWAGFAEPAPAPAVPAPVETTPAPQPDPEPVLSNREMTPARPLEEPMPREAEAPAPALPELAESDEFVRGQLQAWRLPEFWLARQDLVARGTSVLANAAAGRIPHRQLGYLVPAERFPVARVGDQYFLDSRGQQRYNGYVNMLTAVPAEQAVAVFELLTPLMEEALGQLGERRPPRELLLRAIDTVQLRARGLPRLPAEVELVRPNVNFAYADPELEALPDMDKLMLRMGHENISRLDRYLSEIKDLL